MQYIDEAMAMRQKKQQLAQRPDRVLPTSFLHPIPSSTYVLLFVNLQMFWRYISTASVWQLFSI